MANYQHGYCYGILDENGKFVYVGSSVSLSPEKRFARHQSPGQTAARTQDAAFVLAMQFQGK